MGPNGSNDDLEDDFEDFEDFDEQEEHTPVPETLREPKPEPGMGVLDDDDLGDVAGAPAYVPDHVEDTGPSLPRGYRFAGSKEPVEFGGFGRVFACTNPEGVPRYVKILSPRVIADTLVSSDAWHLADAPAPLFPAELHQWRRDEIFVTYIDGTSSQSPPFLGKPVTDFEEFRDRFVACCRALAEMHRRNMSHSFLTPGAFRRFMKRRSEIRLLDCGLDLRRVDASDSAELRRCLEFAAPEEQERVSHGDPKEFNPAADVYSLYRIFGLEASRIESAEERGKAERWLHLFANAGGSKPGGRPTAAEMADFASTAPVPEVPRPGAPAQAMLPSGGLPDLESQKRRSRIPTWVWVTAAAALLFLLIGFMFRDNIEQLFRPSSVVPEPEASEGSKEDATDQRLYDEIDAGISKIWTSFVDLGAEEVIATARRLLPDFKELKTRATEGELADEDRSRLLARLAWQGECLEHRAAGEGEGDWEFVARLMRVLREHGAHCHARMLEMLRIELKDLLNESTDVAEKERLQRELDEVEAVVEKAEER